MTVPPAEFRRLFFALWPDAGVRSAIVDRRAALGRLPGRRVPDENLHLTLVFLGNQPKDRIEEILDAGSAVGGQAFELRLDRFGHFPRSRVVWLGGEAPEAAAGLADALSARMESIGVKVDRRPWRPHVTLFRKVSRRPRFPEIEPVTWSVRDFALVESIPGRPYQVLRSWPVRSGNE